MKTVGVGHLSVSDKSYQDHCCYLTQYPPSNTHRQYYFRQLEHCVNIRGNIFCDTDFLLTWYSHSSHHCSTFLYSFRPLKVRLGKVPFSVGLKHTTEKEMLWIIWIPFVLNTLSSSGILFDIWSQLTLSFMMLILLISHCAITEQSYWLLSYCPHHSLSSQ